MMRDKVNCLGLLLLFLLITDWFNCIEMDTVQGDVWRSKGIQCTFIFVKIMKCASSTIGGIARKIAFNTHAFEFDGIFSFKPKNATSECKFYGGHHPKPHLIPELDFSKGNVEDVFLISSIRRPDNRALSQYFHIDVSRNGSPKSEAAVINGLRKIYSSNFMVNWLGNSFSECRKPNPSYDINMCVTLISQSYDFVLIVERLEESLVALKMLNNLNLEDILYLSGSKRSGGYDDQGYYIEATTRTERINHFLKTRYKDEQFEDMILYRAMDNKLSRTIEKIGVHIFELELELFRKYLEAAKVFCKGRVYYPFNSAGVDQRELASMDCFVNDNGCGRACLMEFVSQINPNLI